MSYTFGTSIKLGLAVEMSPKVFSEQFTNCERMSHAASADSVLLSTCQTHRLHIMPRDTKTFSHQAVVGYLREVKRLLCLLSYLEADVLQVVGVPLYDLLDEVWMCGLQIGASRLVELKLKASPQLRHVESLVPAATNL